MKVQRKPGILIYDEYAPIAEMPNWQFRYDRPGVQEGEPERVYYTNNDGFTYYHGLTDIQKNLWMEPRDRGVLKICSPRQEAETAEVLRGALNDQ